LNSLEAMFQHAHYSWTDPLSAQSFQAWRHQLPEESDRVIEENQAYRIETRTSASSLRVAVLTLRAGDLQPLEERLEFSNQDWVEITEVLDDGAPAVELGVGAEKNRSGAHAVVPSHGASDPLAALPPLATAADELQVVAALHDVGADLGDPVEVSRSGSEVLVSGVGIPPTRQQEIKNAVASKSHVVVRFSDSPPGNVLDQTIAPADSPAGGDVRQLQIRLAEQLGGRANLEQLAAQILDSSELLMARAYALRRLAEQFPSAVEKELNPADENLLKRLRAEHSAAMRERAAEIDRELQPVLTKVNGDAGSPIDSGIPGEPWQASTEALFQSARRLDKLVGVMFGAAPSDTPGGQLPAQLKTGLAQLRTRLDIYERSNK
jgi:hypothetical protein